MTNASTESLQLQEYLDRVGFSGAPRPDLDTLKRLHRGHLAAISYENLDVQLGRRVGFDRAAIFDKLVRSKRGGWCFEMNGLLAWALEQIGFHVTRVAGAVGRDVRGDRSIGNHLALVVALERPYLADVGFGDGLIEPTPLVEGRLQQEFFEFRLERLGDWWRFHNHQYGGAPSFDFQFSPARMEVFERQSDWLQTAPESGFVQNSVCQRFHGNELSILRGKVLKVIGERGVSQRTIEDFADYRDVLGRRFGLELPDLERLWEKVGERHEAWLRQQAT